MRPVRPGLTLVETALAVAVGLAIMAASVVGFNAVQRNARFAQAKTALGTVQTNIGMDKFRTGSPPPFTAVAVNQDSQGKPLYPGAALLPGDPANNLSGVVRYDSTVANVPLAAGDPTPMWDHPVFKGSPVPTPPPGFVPPAGYTAPTAYGAGGWLYDPNTGALRPNLSNKAYNDQRPGGW